MSKMIFKKETYPLNHLRFLEDIVRKAKGQLRSNSLRVPLVYGETGGECVPLMYSNSCVIISDDYPKSTVHLLVMPWDLRINCLNDIVPSNLNTIREMIILADKYIDFLKNHESGKFKNLEFKKGFHALPSMRLLHLHVISTDLISPRIKNKKHYNSFTTDFFIIPEDVIIDVENNGRITINQDVEKFKSLEKAPMKCHICGTHIKDIGVLRSHVPNCFFRSANSLNK